MGDRGRKPHPPGVLHGAYLAEKFAKLTTLDFDAWLDGVDVDGVEITAAEADAGKPTA